MPWKMTKFVLNDLFEDIKLFLERSSNSDQIKGSRVCSNFRMSSPTAQIECTVKLPCRRLSGDGSVSTPSFSLAIFWQQWLDFNTIHEFTFKFYLLILPIVAL